MSSEPIERQTSGTPRPPHNYDKPTVQAEIIRRMSLGESSRSICRSPGMPNWETLMRWLREDAAFRDLYAQAREDMVDAWVMDARDIAADNAKDFYETIETIDSPHGRTTKRKLASDNTSSLRHRLEVETILKVAGKLLPRKYGDKMELSGPNGAALMPAISINIASAPVVGISPLPAVDISPEPVAIEIAPPKALDHEK